MLARRLSTREQFRLRNVVTERGEEHIVDALRGDPRSSCRRQTATAGPCELLKIGILQTPLQTAFRSRAYFVPEADCAFDNVANIASASASCAGSACCRRRYLGRASGIVRHEISVPSDAGRRSRVRGNRGIGRLRTKRRDCRRVGNFHALVAGVLRARGVFVSEVGVDIQFRRRVRLYFQKCLFALNKCQGSIRSRRQIGQLRPAITAEAIAAHYFKSQIKLLGDERECGAGAAAPPRPRIVVSAGG